MEAWRRVRQARPPLLRGYGVGMKSEVHGLVIWERDGAGDMTSQDILVVFRRRVPSLS